MILIVFSKQYQFFSTMWKKMWTKKPSQRRFCDSLLCSKDQRMISRYASSIPIERQQMCEVPSTPGRIEMMIIDRIGRVK